MKDYWNTLARTFKLVRPFWTGSDRWKAWGWLSLLLFMLGLIAFINVRISFAERAVMTSLQEVRQEDFWRDITQWGLTLLFALFICGNFGWVKARLHSAWRNFLSKDLLGRYHDDAFFHHINLDPQVDNPDQRIGQDINVFCDKVLTICMSIIDSLLAFISFITILWLIKPSLVMVAVGYAAVGTLFMVGYGKRVIGMFANQEKLEADFRRNMVYASEHALSIASYHGAKRELKTALSGLKGLITHWNGVLSVQRNLVLFKTGYDYIIMLVPLCMTAPLFFAHQMDIGGVFQAGSSFGRVLGALSLLVSQFQMFAELAASVQRLGGFSEAITRYEKERDGGVGVDEVRTASNGARVSVKNVSVFTPDKSRVLVENVSFELKQGQRLLVVGPSGVGKSTLLRIIAGLLRKGKGEVVRPGSLDTVFVPQKSYMPVGTLRDQVTYPQLNAGVSDARVLDVLRKVNLGHLATRYEGGLDEVQPWQHLLSGGEHQRLGIARVLLARPQFVILDEATAALDAENERMVYRLITEAGMTAISVAHRETLATHHDFVLQLKPEGEWQLHDAATYEPRL